MPWHDASQVENEHTVLVNSSIIQAYVNDSAHVYGTSTQACPIIMYQLCAELCAYVSTVSAVPSNFATKF